MKSDLPQHEAASALAQFGELAVVRSFLDGAPAFAVVKDAEGRYVYVNRFMANAHGRADLLGKTVHDLLPSDIAEATRAIEREILDTGRPRSTREVFPNIDGKTLATSLVRFPIGVGTERLLAILGFDVTELARSEERQAALLDLATDAIHVRDLEGRITYWNRAAERLYGWTAEEVRGRNALEILFPQDERSLHAIAAIQRQLVAEQSWSGELAKVTRSGEEILVESRWTLVPDDDGQPEAMLVIDSDITKKKQLEQQLMRALRIETIGSLAGGVAHDLNNMLMPILMGAAVIRKRVTDPQLEHTVAHLEQSARKAADLVRGILTFIRGATDEKELVPAQRLLDDLLKFLNATFPRAIRVVSRADEELPAIFCRSSAIHQVLVNLCVNARDAMSGAGTLAIDVKNVDVDSAYAQMSSSTAAPGRYVAFAIGDTGNGIAGDQLGRIFEPYFTTKEPGRGTGLGLAIALSTIEEIGGFITVETELGVGATFTVHLPSTDFAAVAPVAPDDIPTGNGESILLVDDEGFVLEVVSEMLEAYNYRVFTAADGSDAIAKLATEAAGTRVLVTDVTMPIVDGIALARFVRRAHPAVRVIIASGSNDPQRREATQHADRYLQKPYSAATLLRAVADLLAIKE